MLIKFVEKVNYTSWFSGNVPKSFPQFSANRPTYVEMVKSTSSTIPVEKSRNKDPSLRTNLIRTHQAPVRLSPPKHKQWLIKNHEVVKVDFDDLRITTKLFASNDWRMIRKQLELLSQTKIVINPSMMLMPSSILTKLHPWTSLERKRNGRLGALSTLNLKNGIQFDIVGHS